MFKLDEKECKTLSRSLFVTMNRSPQRGENIKYSPYAFTEQGVYTLTMKRGNII